MNSRTKSSRFLLATIGVCLVASLSLVSAQVRPMLQMQTSERGQVLSWSASIGYQYVLQSSDDFVNWETVALPVVQKSGRQQVTVPTDQARKFYQLVKEPAAPIQRAYVGSETCKTCHRSKYDAWIQSGHPYKLNKVFGAPPTYPFTEVPNPPDGVAWDDVTYVIGGANWKARFIDTEGYIITGTNVQFNVENGEWVAYHASDPRGTKPYDCGACHTTGWVPTSEGGGHQDGLPGMAGSFVAQGIHCEACHGPGSEHIKNFPNDIIVDRSSAMCGQCHVRGATDSIQASGGFIRHHEQYNEMLSTGHQALSCNDCHDPHLTTRHNQTGGIIRACTDCHSAALYTTTDVHGFIDCIECHMPKAAKSAAAVTPYQGDVASHIWKINPNADGQMFTPDGKFAVGTTGVTLQYACYHCHRDPQGVGGCLSIKTLEELSAKATNFHYPQ